MQTGKCIIFSAPSGAGKTTLVKHLLSLDMGLEFSVSATSRTARSGEVDKEDYYFLQPNEFEEKIKNNDFVEWEEVYRGTLYGTLKSEINRIWKKDHAVIFDVDVEGAMSLKNYFGNRALSIFVKPPSVDILRERLSERGTETQEKLNERLQKATKELTREKDFDKSILNADLKTAQTDAEKIVKEFLAS